ncbi:cytochrome P450 [Mycena galopus ATCC 62051]|nr:cytochrome P450 [Mycena galopus ATCC 62051]
MVSFQAPVGPLLRQIRLSVAAQSIKTVTSQPDTFQKDVEPYQLVNFYGQNLISIQGADWKRHRKVANPAFNEASNAFVWTETVRVINEWFAEMDAATNMDPSSSIAINLTLLVIASASFGRRASWQEDSSVPPPAGHLLSFRKAVTGAISHIFVQALTPKWIHALSERVHLPLLGPVLKETRVSFEALRLHMHELVSLSRAWVVGGKASNMDAGLLRNLVEANMAEDDDITHKKLTDNEVLSNIFVKTSAHSLSFAIALLALYPDIQQKIYEETLRAWPDGCPTSASPSEYTLAAFHETLRLFPQVPRLGKIVQADTTLIAHKIKTGTTDELDATQFSVPVRAGSIVILDIPAVHMNPMYWGPDAEDFKPERFVDTESYRWPRDAFYSFSGGPRSCIGQRFSLTESVCTLASLVRRYEIFVPDGLATKSFEEQKSILLGYKPRLTLVPTNCVVRLRRRDVA